MLKTPELRYVSYKSGRLAYREAGEGPVLFFLHGMNGSSRSWLYIFEALAPSFRIIAWDAPSFGASDTYGDRIEDYVRAARALLQAVEINEAIVIGHSMGGVIAARFATDPGFLTKGLVLSSTHLGFGLPEGAPLMERYATRMNHIRSKGGDIAYGIERAKRSTPEGTSEAVIQFLADIATGAKLEGIRDGGRMSQETDNSKIGHAINVPVLILSGGRDNVIAPEMHTALVAAFPSAQQEVFPNAGHASYVECSKLFTEQIKQFANRCKSYGLSAPTN